MAREKRVQRGVGVRYFSLFVFFKKRGLLTLGGIESIASPIDLFKWFSLTRSKEWTSYNILSYGIYLPH